MHKKGLICSFLAAILCSGTVQAFHFPEPDWGAIYKERKQMVSQTEFELYCEADPSLAPYFGARLEPTAGTYIGMTADMAEPYLPLGSYLTYVESIDQPDLYYPSNTMIRRDDVVTMVGWNFSSIDGLDYQKIRQTLDMLNSYGKPMFVRFANEMNVSALGDEPAQYVEAFRNVANMVHEYPNLAVVWSPNDLGSLDRPFEYYYPGDEYVDWVGISCYMIRYFGFDKNAPARDHVFFMTDEYAWATNKVQPIIDFMQRNNIQKPVMLSEGGVACYNSYGDDYTGWSEPRMRNMYWYLVMKYPQIKMINYFNAPFQNRGEHYYFSDKPELDSIFRSAAESGAYLRSAYDRADFVFKPAYAAGNMHLPDQLLPVYTYLYTENQPEACVNYWLDNEWVSMSETIPYQRDLDLSALADGEHKLTISTLGMSKDYYFYKIGNFVRFGGVPAVWEETPAPQEPVQEEIRVLLNGEELAFPDQKPVIVNERALVPFRVIFEALGVSVDWNGDTRTVYAQKDGTEVSLTIGEAYLYRNGEAFPLDVPAQILENRTMVPLRAVSDAYACHVEWDAANRIIRIDQTM